MLVLDLFEITRRVPALFEMLSQPLTGQSWDRTQQHGGAFMGLKQKRS
jgi:hypothetical protein